MNDTYEALRFCLCVPHLDHPGITTNQDCPRRLLPVHNKAGTLAHLDHFIERPEGRDHLQGALLKSRVVIAVHTYNPIRYRIKSESGL